MPARPLSWSFFSSVFVFVWGFFYLIYGCLFHPNPHKGCKLKKNKKYNHPTYWIGHKENIHSKQLNCKTIYCKQSKSPNSNSEIHTREKESPTQNSGFLKKWKRKNNSVRAVLNSKSSSAVQKNKKPLKYKPKENAALTHTLVTVLSAS